jgi:polyisoprenoid-binding protein YceI
MKKTIIIVIILLIAGFIIFSNNTEAPVKPEGNQGEKMMEGSQIDSMEDIEAGEYSIDTERSFITWSGKKIIGDPHTGKIFIESGSVVVNEETIESNEIIIDMSSITSDEDLDSLVGHLQNEDFFDVENNPTATFLATGLQATGSGSFEMKGNLTIKNVTNEITLPISVVKVDNKFNIKGNVEIDRTLWDINFMSGNIFTDLGDKAVEDTIKIGFDVWTNE